MTRVIYLSDESLVKIKWAGKEQFYTEYGKPMYGGVFGSGEFALVAELNSTYTLPTVDYWVLHTRSAMPISHRHDTKAAAIQEARRNLREVPRAHLNKMIGEQLAKAVELEKRIAAAEKQLMEERNAAAQVDGRNSRDRAGYVYLIRCDDRYKIGKSVDVESRLRTMMLPSKPEIIATGHFAKPYEVERELHAAYKLCRENGEWFRLTATDVEAIKLRLDQAEPKLRAVK